MGISEFSLSVLSSILGNLLTPKIRNDEISVQKIENVEEVAVSEPVKKLVVRPLTDRRPWARFGEHFRKLLLSIDYPNIYLFIESEPSTFYNLVTVVVEDGRTLDWYPFEQNVTFEGSGGGWNTARQLNWEIEEARRLGSDLRVSIRVAYSSDLSGLITGDVTWQQIKERSIPALISSDTHFWAMQDRFTREVLEKRDGDEANSSTSDK